MSERKLLLWTIAVVATGFLIHLLASVLTPFIVALLLAYMGSPAVDYFERHGISRATASLLLFVVVAVGGLALIIGLAPVVERQFADFSQRLPAYIGWLQRRVSDVRHGVLAPDVLALKHTLITRWEDVGAWAGKALSFATHSGLTIAGWALNLLLIPVLTFYLLRDWRQIIARIDRLVPPARRARVTALAREIDATLSGFVRGQLSVMLVLAVFYATALWATRLGLGLLIGLFSGLVSFIPYLGFFAGFVFALVAALLQFHGSLLPMGWIAAVFAFGHLIDSLLLTPRLIGHSIGLHPVVVIFAVMSGGRLFGFIGVLLALPVSAVVMVWIRHLYYGDVA
ncbi:MAG: AI-2E family transporter [Acidiferrobacteraceae bacterium]